MKTIHFEGASFPALVSLYLSPPAFLSPSPSVSCPGLKEGGLTELSVPMLHVKIPSQEGTHQGDYPLWDVALH